MFSGPEVFECTLAVGVTVKTVENLSYIAHYYSGVTILKQFVNRC